MPDIAFKFVGDDEVTPTINKIKGSMEGVTASAEHTAESMKQMKEFMSGIGYNIGLWNVGFMASSKALDLVTGGIQETIRAAQSSMQMQNRLNLSYSDAVNSWGAIVDAAQEAKVPVGDVSKSMLTLMEQTGMSRDAATKMAEAIQARFHETNVDLTETVAKAQNFRASIAEIAKASLAGGPYAAFHDKAFAALRAEAMRPYEELALSRRQQMEDRAFEANVRRIDREMEYRHLGVNREIEDRHRALGYEMEDRGRAMSRQMEDAQRQASLTAAVGAAMPGAFDVLQGKHPTGPKAWTAYLGAQMLRPEITKGEAEIQKQTGIAPGTIEAAMRAGMSPGVVLQAAQMAREERRAAEQRAFEDESIALQRQMVAELTGTGRSQVDEKMSRSIGLQDQGIALAQRHQDERNKFEDDASQERYDLNQAVTDANAADKQQRAKEEQEKFRGGVPGIPAGAPRGAAAVIPGQAALREPEGQGLPFPYNLLPSGTSIPRGATPVRRPGPTASRAKAEPGSFEFWTHQTPTARGAAEPGSFEWYTHQTPAQGGSTGKPATNDDIVDKIDELIKVFTQ